LPYKIVSVFEIAVWRVTESRIIAVGKCHQYFVGERTIAKSYSWDPPLKLPALLENDEIDPL